MNTSAVTSACAVLLSKSLIMPGTTHSPSGLGCPDCTVVHPAPFPVREDPNQAPVYHRLLKCDLGKNPTLDSATMHSAWRARKSRFNRLRRKTFPKICGSHPAFLLKAKMAIAPGTIGRWAIPAVRGSWNSQISLSACANRNPERKLTPAQHT